MLITAALAAAQTAKTAPAAPVPWFPAEEGRIIVADTLRFPWPPADTSKLSIPAPKDTSVDTASSKTAKTPAPVNADIDTNINTDINTNTDTNINTNTDTNTTVKRPKTRQELGKMSREELFRLAFGRGAPEKPRALTVRLFGEGRPAGSTEIVYNDDFTAFAFRSPAFSRLLDRMILPEARAAAGDSAGRFRSEVLEAAGYVLEVDDAKFELRVAFPPGDKGVQVTYLYGGGEPEGPRGEEIPAAGVSFYMNYTVDDRARYLRYGYGPAYAGARYGGGDTLLRDPATANVEGALAAGGWVFESSGWLREPYGGAPLAWENVRRDDARAVRDFVKRRARLEVGDITAATSVVPGPMAGGVRYERNGYFFGNNPRDELNSVTFFMPEAGEAEVYIDGSFRRRLYLPAGHHRLGGFGGAAGRNRVRLLLRTAGGAVEEVPFEFVLSNPRIMALGDVRYAFSAGVRREYAPSPACFSYDAGEPVASADVAYGLHRAVNTGLSAVATRRAGQGGAQLSFGAGGMGFVDARAIASYVIEERLSGGRFEGSYTADLKRATERANLFLTGGPNRAILPLLSLALRGYYQTGYYSSRMFDEPFTGVNGGIGGASGNVGVNFWRGSLSAFGGVNFYRETGYEVSYCPYDYNYGVRVSQGLGGSYVSVSAGESVRGGVRSPYFNLNSSHAFGADLRVGGHKFSASVNAAMGSRYVFEEDGAVAGRDSLEFEWSYGGMAGWGWSNDASGVGARAYSAEVRVENDESPTAAASLRHTYNRARLSVDYDLLFEDYGSYDWRNHSARGLLAGSFMFADGLWAFGQPVGSGGGFALVAPVGDLRGAKVHVNRSRGAGGETGRSGLLGAAYHNRLLAYAPTELSLTLTGVPVGAFMEQSRYYAEGSYKRGFALRVGRRAQVIARALFVERRGGRPLGHTYLTVEVDADGEEGASGAAPRAAFTGADGVLQMGGLAPGCRYRVRFRASSRLRDAVFEIPADASGIYEHPGIEVERED